MNPNQSSGELSPELYQLQSVTLVDTPSESEGTWFRYVIAQGDNEITGLRAGSAEEVRIAVREMVENLNVRSRGKTVKKTKTVELTAVRSIPVDQSNSGATPDQP